MYQGTSRQGIWYTTPACWSLGTWSFEWTSWWRRVQSGRKATLMSSSLRTLLTASVLTTDALCATGWSESKDRYWLVCVAFLNTEVVRDPLSSLCRHTSKNGSFPSVSSSAVNWMHGMTWDNSREIFVQCNLCKTIYTTIWGQYSVWTLILQY